MARFKKHKLQSSNLLLAIIALVVVLGMTLRLVVAQQTSSRVPSKEKNAQDRQAPVEIDRTEKKETAQDASRENEVGLRTI